MQHLIIIDDILKQVNDCDHWWVEFLNWVMKHHLDELLINRVREDLIDNVDVRRINMANKYVLMPPYVNYCPTCNNILGQSSTIFGVRSDNKGHQ